MTEVLTGEVLPTDVEGWAERIRGAMQRSAASIVELGAEWRLAKERVGHGQFGKLLKEVGVAERSVQRLMVIASNDALVKSAIVADLPTSVVVLEVLAGIPADQLELAIDAGKVHAYTQRSEAEELVRSLRAPVDASPGEAIPNQEGLGEDVEPDANPAVGEPTPPIDAGAPAGQPAAAGAPSSEPQQPPVDGDAGDGSASSSTSRLNDSIENDRRGRSSSNPPAPNPAVIGAMWLNELKAMLASSGPGLAGVCTIAEGYRQGTRHAPNLTPDASLVELHATIRQLHRLAIDAIGLLDVNVLVPP